MTQLKAHGAVKGPSIYKLG